MAFPAASLARLATVPWEALPGIAARLDGPIRAVLQGRAAERELDRFLRAHRGLAREERAAAAESVFGVGLWRRRLAWHLGMGDADPSTAPPRHLLVALVRDLAGDAGAERLAAAAAGSVPRRAGPPPDLATFYSLPDWLADTLRREARDDAPALADALGQPGPVFLRANLLRTSREALADHLRAEGITAHAGRFAPACLRVDSPRPNLLGVSAWRDGLFEPQDEGSQLLGAAVGARAGESVLDACAGAGGKTLLLAAEVGGAGRVHACDVDAARLARLESRARRAGAREVVRIEGETPPPELRVDRAIVDAPCSELGPLRRGPDLRFRIDPATFEALPRVQLTLLARAARLVKPGGRLVYATCTFRREENDEVARSFERAHPEWRRVAPDVDPLLLDEHGWLRTWPHAHGTDAVFAAAWQRS
jgi:16S rRNA (cytosine967-C5)-methyltransferase